MKNFKILLFLLILSLIYSCDETTGPNELKGETNLKLTEVGNEFGIYISVLDQYVPAFNNIKDSVKITKNENGIVTFEGSFTTDLETLRQLDTIFNTHQLPEQNKRQIVDAYLDKFGLSIDTSDHNNLKLKFKAKFKITSEGIQDFVYSKGDLSKPFTMVKYSAKIGDKYEFITPDGEKITRTVIQTHTTEDWEIGFIIVKTTRVEQLMNNDPIIKKITYIGNHKYGLVGAIFELKDGKTFNIKILPWNVL